MALPFPAHRFDATVMALVLVFVPDPAKGIEEMVRVVGPGGTVATYMWDMLGGGFPLDPILVEMRKRLIRAPAKNFAPACDFAPRREGNSLFDTVCGSNYLFEPCSCITRAPTNVWP